MPAWAKGFKLIPQKWKKLNGIKKSENVMVDESAFGRCSSPEQPPGGSRTQVNHENRVFTL